MAPKTVLLETLPASFSGCLVIKGSEKFVIPGTECIITPLQADADFYLNSLAPGTDEDSPSKLGTIPGNGKYTRIDGLISNTEYYLDTEESFQVRWSK